jgi:hypothetical protein
MADFRTDTSAIKVEKQQGMSLADMLNISKSSYELSKLKELYPAMIQKEQALSKSAQIGANLAEQTSPLELQSKQQSTESAGIDLMTKKQQKIADGYVSKIFDPMIVNAAKNPNSVNKDELVKNITKWGIQQGKEAGVDQETTMKLIQPYIDIAQNNPAQLQDYLKQRHILGLSPESRTGAMTPSGIAVNTGASGATVNTNPFAGMPPGQAIPGTQFKQELAPSTIVVDEKTGREKYLGGPLSKLGPTEITQAEVASKEIAANQTEYKTAANTVSTLKNIKGLASKAYTGVGSDYKALVTGIANAIGIDAGTLEKTATDELAKNSAVLTLAGGNTDLARQIAEMATPGHKLTEKAIKDISNQLIGVQRMNQARLEYVAPYKDNPKEYNKHLTIFDKYKDFRIFQLADMTPAEIKEYKASMSKEQRDEISKKIKEAEAVGIDIPEVK